MPVLNGVDATRILRARGFTLPIIAVTGNALLEDCEAFLSVGANEVLTKPVSKAKLEAAISKYCGHAGSAAAPASSSSSSFATGIPAFVPTLPAGRFGSGGGGGSGAGRGSNGPPTAAWGPHAS